MKQILKSVISKKQCVFALSYWNQMTEDIVWKKVWLT